MDQRRPLCFATRPPQLDIYPASVSEAGRTVEKLLGGSVALKRGPQWWNRFSEKWFGVRATGNHVASAHRARLPARPLTRGALRSLAQHLAAAVLAGCGRQSSGWLVTISARRAAWLFSARRRLNSRAAAFLLQVVLRHVAAVIIKPLRHAQRLCPGECRPCKGVRNWALSRFASCVWRAHVRLFGGLGHAELELPAVPAAQGRVTVKSMASPVRQRGL